ncbi:unnamed protein product [Linum trigynum]|uniref:MADS-box domain-containing protein n=1 Tax=Linum trigynum TaxID=586398 RepID=A0AAV2D7E2_9ROSI
MIAGQHTDETPAVPTATIGGKRRKIEIKRIEQQSSLFVAFSKRRTGLFGKLDKFCKMSPRGTEAAIVTFSPAANKAHAHGSPSVDPVLQRFLDYMAGAEAAARKRSPQPERRRLSIVAAERRDGDEDGSGVSCAEESMELEELKESETALLRAKRDLEMRMSEDLIRESRTKKFL